MQAFIAAISPRIPTAKTAPPKPPKTKISNPPGAPVLDTLFSGIQIADGPAYIGEHVQLVYPSAHPKAAILERTPIQAVRGGMVLPILQFTSSTFNFDTLTNPSGYYVAITEHMDGSLRLALAYATPGANLPKILMFPKVATSAYSVLALSDTAIRGNMLAPHIMDALKKLYSPLIAPDTPMAARLSDHGGVTSGGSRDASLKVMKAFAPLKRALHYDTTKFNIITQHVTDMKLTDPAIGVNIRNLRTNPALNRLAAMQTENIPHLLSFNFCVELDFSGKDHKLDALNLHAFTTGRSAGDMSTFTDLRDIWRTVNYVRQVYMTMTMEQRGAPNPFWGRIFNGLLDQLAEPDPELSIDHLDIKFVAWQMNIMFVAWSNLFKGETHATKTIEEFAKLNEDILRIDYIEWQDKCARLGTSKYPAQKVPPPKKIVDESGKRGATTPNEPNRKKGKTQHLQTPPPPPPPPAPAAQPKVQTPLQLPAQPPQICIRHLFHKKDAARFPLDCTKTRCDRNHRVKLHGGKLTPDDKADVRASLGLMTGKFAQLALAELDNMF